MHHSKDRITHTTSFVIPVVERVEFSAEFVLTVLCNIIKSGDRGRGGGGGGRDVAPW